MNRAIEEMLENYNIENIYNRKNAMREIMQEIILCGLSRAGFFKHAAFYGGTALRIFHGLDRFSEDLDFSLESEDLDFDLASYFPTLEKEVKSFGLNMEIKEKEKANIKGNTKEHLLLFYANEKIISNIANNEVIKIKFEVDIKPPAFATYEYKYRLLPAPYEVKLYDMPSLFAGKIHAILCRGWKNRIKGRDLYDYVFYLSKKVAVNQKHLRERLIDSNYIDKDRDCSIEEIKRMLIERFDNIDYTQAKQDVEPFIYDSSTINIWNADFFKQITENIY